MLILVVAGVALVGVWAILERRAVEPVLPLGLFKNKVFSAASVIGFVVGFALFGALTFLPLYFQVVRGLSPTISGLQLVPLMGAPGDLDRFGLLDQPLGPVQGLPGGRARPS